MCFQILRNQDWYRKIPVSMVEKFQKEFGQVLIDAYHQDIINKDLYKSILVKYIKIPVLYSTEDA